MNQTAMQPLTTLEPLTDTQASTNMHFFSALQPLETSTIPTFTELLAEYTATVSKPEVAWNFLSNVTNQPDPLPSTKPTSPTSVPSPFAGSGRNASRSPALLSSTATTAVGKASLLSKLPPASPLVIRMPDGTSTLPGWRCHCHPPYTMPRRPNSKSSLPWVLIFPVSKSSPTFRNLHLRLTPEVIVLFPSRRISPFSFKPSTALMPVSSYSIHSSACSHAIDSLDRPASRAVSSQISTSTSSNTTSPASSLAIVMQKADTPDHPFLNDLIISRTSPSVASYWPPIRCSLIAFS